MRALVVLHDHASSSGFVGERLRQRGWEVDEVTVVPPERHDDPGVDHDFGDPADYDLLVPTGSPWSAYDDALIGSWLLPELEWLVRAVDQDVPVLGICFGAQAYSRALGGEVLPSETPEIGWQQVYSDEPDLVPQGLWFQWHYDRFTLPPGAREVARNDAGPQAYVHRRNLCVQFHPEVTPQGVGTWLDTGGEEKARALGIDPDRLRQITDARGAEARARAHALVDHYLTDVAGLS